MAVKVSIAMVSMLREALATGGGVKYKRLAEAIEQGIHEGAIEPGCKLPPHRLLADSVGVTVGTISRAYAELERTGKVVARVGDGTYVRQRGMERARDTGFRNVSEEPRGCFDMSRNQPIPGYDAAFFSQGLQALALDPDAVQRISGYTEEAGLPAYRQAGAQWLSHQDFVAHAEQVVCVNGAQHGLMCTLMALLKAGDTMVSEHLTYPGLISIARSLGIKLLGVAMDDEGLLPQALDDLCRQHRVAAVYCTPTLQNPTAAVMSTARRVELVAVCRAHNLLIIEDEAHAVLAQERPLPLSHFAPERTVLIASLSKAVSAGLRVGYVHAPQPLASRLAAAVRASCWMATPLVMELATSWLETGIARHLLGQQVVEVSRRKTLVLGLLEGLEYSTHPHSPHFWIKVPEPWRASQIEAELKQAGYLIATAEAFAVGHGAVPQCIRLSVCHSQGDDRLLLEGVEAVAQALRATV
ncbi:DNA-binding transcriptional regulator, MocR family, contains an aminotransferase domain [Pseudomonas sp. ok272]|uniref:aminotransferase-like domain-containing protein n=1 Tax=unclassified Pseudomonas TaxID=196821 RepID=UPI0008D5C4E6|nr:MULTISPECIES: PLP-dependent aminotransferase family protein [unclassified Pseudomonas]SEN68129.1 DNA-binding transcriptional regulator, MocR family, contains an aminotransferase domain [Pseudomonas sp. ok272]SFN34247.1 DNA-binding transcriptional regulator, MocR family, contains an aminotransferase domain [Pseudomonas sp. ok602]